MRGIGVGAWLAVAAGGRAEDEAKAAPPRGILLWKNGDRMPGEWLGVEAGWLSWQAQALAEPVRLWLPRLHGWEAGGGVGLPVPMKGAWRVRLGDGSVFAAGLAGADREGFELGSEHAGVLKCGRGGVAELLRGETGGGLLFAGPAGEAGWVHDNPGPAPGQRWQGERGGVLRTASIDQSISLPMELPEKVRVDFWLRTDCKQPQFRWRFRRGGQGVEVETWMEELVGRGAGRPARMATLYEKECGVVLGIDFRKRRATAFDLAGKELGVWEVRGEMAEEEKAKPNAGGLGGLFGAIVGAVAQGMMQQQTGAQAAHEIANGVTLINLGGDLCLERLLVREWDGKPPVGRAMKTAFVETVGGAIHAGEVVAVANGELEISGGKRVGLDQVAWIHRGPVERLKAAESESGSEPEHGLRVRYDDGSLFCGEWVSATTETVMLTNAFLSEPMTLRRAGMRAMRWHVPEPLPGPLTSQQSHWDVWQREEGRVTTRGQWQAAAGAVPHWRPEGAERAVPIRMVKSWRLQRASPEVRNREAPLPALAYLDSAEVIPVDVEAWDREQGVVRVPMAVNGRAQALPLSMIRALELPGAGLRERGFEDPGWVQTAGPASGLVRAANGQSVTLEPGVALGHGSFLQGTQLNFALGGRQAYGGLRLRLFCDGLDDKAAHVALLVSRNGSTVYCGVEDPQQPGQMRGQYARLPLVPDKPCGVSVKWNERMVELLIHGDPALKVDLAETKRSGLGMVLEPAGVWGNTAEAAVLTNLSLKATPGARTRPSLDEELKAWALQIPRRWADDPPRHLLVAHNGDLLRGTVEAMDARRLTLRSGMETMEVARERVAMLVLPRGGGRGKDEDEDEDEDEVWVSTAEGGRVRMMVDSYGPDWVEGRSKRLGRCRMAVTQVVAVATEAPGGGVASFVDWKLEQAPEPVLPEGGGQAEGEGLAGLRGREAPGFELELAGGGKFALKEAKGKVVVLDFWATWCGPCLKAMPEVMAAMKDLPAEKVRLIGVNQAQSKAEVAAFLKTRGWDLEVVLDWEQKVGRQYAVEGIPHTVVVGPDGKVAWVKTGYSATAAKELREAVQKLLP